MIDTSRILSQTPSTPMGGSSAPAPAPVPTTEPLKVTMTGDTLALRQGIMIGGCVPRSDGPFPTMPNPLPPTPAPAPVPPVVSGVPVATALPGFLTRFMDAVKAFFNTLFPHNAQADTAPTPSSIPESKPPAESIPLSGLFLTDERAKALLNQGISQSLALVQQLQTSFQPQMDQAMQGVQQAMMEMTQIIQTGSYQGKPIKTYGEELLKTVDTLRGQLQTQAGPFVDTARQEIERALKALEGVAAELSQSA